MKVTVQHEIINFIDLLCVKDIEVSINVREWYFIALLLLFYSCFLCIL